MCSPAQTGWHGVKQCGGRAGADGRGVWVSVGQCYRPLRCSGTGEEPKAYTKTFPSWEWEDVAAAGLPRQSSITFHLCREWVHLIQKQ